MELAIAKFDYKAKKVVYNIKWFLIWKRKKIWILRREIRYRFLRKPQMGGGSVIIFIGLIKNLIKDYVMI